MSDLRNKCESWRIDSRFSMEIVKKTKTFSVQFNMTLWNIYTI